MSYIELTRKLEGLHTLETIRDMLNIKKSTAIKYMHLLRKKGYVSTQGGGKQPKLYRIGLDSRETGNPGLYDIINEYSPIKLRAIRTRIYGKKLSIEEVIVRAIETKEFRTILAALALFNHIKDWGILYEEAKEKEILKKVGALYDVARTIVKTRKMDERIYNQMLNKKNKKEFIVEGLKSKDFFDIERKWNVYLPFNKQDLRRYKE